MTELRPRVGISSCLLGQPVRFNGGHSRDRFLTQVLARYVDWVAICPEVEIGLGAPREALRLTEGGRLVSRAGQDHTDAVAALAERRRPDLTGLHGYVLKSRSPSCGLYSVRVYSGDAAARGNGRGAFASRVLAACPLLPVEEEGRLNDPLLRETFIEQVFARQRLGQLFGGRWRARDLVDFHARHKLQLLAHDPVRCVRAGRLVATARAQPAGAVAAQYTALFAQAMARRVSRGRHSNALQHAFGLVSSCLDDTRRHDMVARIDAYRRGEVPLSVPVALIRHHAAGCGMGYLQEQTYLDPFPAALGLRNHAE
ncbi:MAG TPA: DUF523 and DUF1722 domain-containing protein [Streptosporangiaceae bacterium]|nr:DUF523 and DUF1722 domain-containing protein [Streptosporangiaceae bacterium]